MQYKSGDCALLAGLSQVRLNQLFARSAAAGGIPLGNLRSPAGTQRQYDHIDIVILALAASVADGPGEMAGPPMRDMIVWLDNARDVLADLFKPEVSEVWTREELADAGAVAERSRARAVRDERSVFWTDRGSDQWLAVAIVRYTNKGGAELAGQLGLHKPDYGSLLQIGAALAKTEAELRGDPYARLHHVFTFNLSAVVEEVAERALVAGIAFPQRRTKFSPEAI